MQLSVASRVTAGLRANAWRSGRDGSSCTALLVSGTLLSQAAARAIHPQNCRDLSVGDSADDAGAIARSGSIKNSENMTFDKVRQVNT